MISRIQGKLTQVTDKFALVENSGLYYEVLLPSALAERLKEGTKLGEDISFETIYYIEAGDKKSNHYPKMLGFISPIDKEFFSLFTQVPGLGVKKGLKSLIIPVSEIASAIENRDIGTLSRLPGVGKRLAEKIIAELNGKTTKFALVRNDKPLAAQTNQNRQCYDEALEILTQLQYSPGEARKMIENAMKENPKVQKSENLIAFIFHSVNQVKVGT